jgi:hypothetical protein
MEQSAVQNFVLADPVVGAADLTIASDTHLLLILTT